jgi:hypothetical protein
MREYRLYCLNDRGRVSRSHEYLAENDDDALAIARNLKAQSRCELWCRDRLVADLPAHGENR